MNRDQIDWLASQPLPMFLIERRPCEWNRETVRFRGECWLVTIQHPRRSMMFECSAADLLPLIQRGCAGASETAYSPSTTRLV